MAMPEYTDGVLELLRIEEDNLQDFPVEKVRSTGMHIWYRELIRSVILFHLEHTGVTEYDARLSDRRLLQNVMIYLE